MRIENTYFRKYAHLYALIFATIHAQIAIGYLWTPK